MRLDELKPGSAGVVARVEGCTPVLLRLQEMGLAPDAVVEMVRKAPLGDPLEVVVRETRLCVRRDDARCFVLAETAP